MPRSSAHDNRRTQSEDRSEYLLDEWTDSLGAWQEHARRLAGNAVELIELSCEELDEIPATAESLWNDIASNGIVLVGQRIRLRSGRPVLVASTKE